MRLLSLILLCIGHCSILYAQPTEKITNESGDKWAPMRETYYVLKSDLTTRHGPYELVRKGQPVLKGYYKNGKKDSVWESYGNKNVLLARKWYADGVQKGIWEFYTWKGDPESQYDFSTGKITWLTKAPADTITYYYSTDGGPWIRGTVDNPPLQLVSSGEWLSFLNRSFRYPDEAVSNMQQGKVLIAVTIDKTGNLIDYNVFQSAAPVLDQEALRIVRLAACEYLPAVKDGKKVKSMYLIPIQFKLEVAK